MATKVGELIKRAKGDDRSVREYSRQSGVDAATISKIINGEYIPKKHDVYSKLSSAEAAPRGGVTYRQLVEAAADSVSYKAGVAAGAAIISGMLTRFGSIPVAGGILSAKGTEQKEGEKSYQKIQNRISRFVALANGVLLSELAKNGTRFQIVAQKYKDILENDYDTLLSVEDEKITEILLRYVYLTDEEAEVNFLVENTPRRVVESLVFLRKSYGRHVCILTNCRKVFDYLVTWKDKLSYDGFLSTILVNEENASIQDEALIMVPDDCIDNVVLTSKGHIVDTCTNQIIGQIQIMPENQMEEQ